MGATAATRCFITSHLAIVDGVAGLVWAPRGDIRGVIEFLIVDGKITALNVTGNAKRIRQLEIVPLDS